MTTGYLSPKLEARAAPEKGGFAELWLASRDGGARLTLYAEENRHIYGGCLSPDGKYVIATISEPASGAKNTIVPNYVTESAYTEDIPGRTKVGDAQNRTRLIVIDTETGET